MKKSNLLLCWLCLLLLFSAVDVYALNCNAGEPKILYKEDFTFENDQSGDFVTSAKTYVNAKYGTKINTNYKEPANCGPYFCQINDDEIGIVTHSDKGGYWPGRGLTGTTGNNSSYTPPGSYLPKYIHDGFLIINCNATTTRICSFNASGLCPNSVCSFSANICSLCDNKPDLAGRYSAPGRVRFVVKGKNNGKTYVDEALDIPNYAKPKWGSFSTEFVTDDESEYVFELYNAFTDSQKYPKDDGSGGVNGNDIAMDDVVFAACAPSINLYSDGGLTKKDIVLECKTSTDLYINTREVQDYFQGHAYFIMQESTDKKTWKNVGDVQQGNKFPISIQKSDTNGRYFRIWAGGSEQAVRDAAAHGQGSDCSQLTAVSDPIKATYYCPCTVSETPKPNNYSKCPSTTKLNLSTLVPTSYTGKYTWYADATTNTPMGSTLVDVNTVQSKTYYVSYTENQSNYCESERAKVTVEVNGPIQFDVTPKDITTCLYQGAPLTYTAKATSPSGVTFKWQDESKKQLGTGATYTLPATPGKGTITVVASDPAGKACDAEKNVTYNLTPVNKLTLSASPTFVCTKDAKSTITATIESGEGNYTIYKKVGSGTETKVKSGVVTSADKTVTYQDNSVATVATTVTYRMVFGEGKCQDEQETTVEVGSEFEIPVESSAVSPKDRVCMGSPITLSTTYTPVAGETLIWEENGAEIGRGTSVNISAVNAKTTYTVRNQNGTCDGNGSITIEVDKPVKAVIKSSTPAVCENNPVDLMDTNADKASQYQWQKSEDGGVTWQDMSGKTGREIKGYIPEKTAEYRLVTKNGESLCEAESDPITVTVTPPPSIESITEHTICISNPSVKITAKISSDAVPYEWFKNGASFEKGTTTAGQSEIVLNDTNVAAGAATVRYRLVLGTTGCSDEKETTVVVTDRVTIPITSNATDDRICAGDLFNLTASYELVGGEWLKWEKAGEELAEKGTKLIGETITESSVLYKVTLMDGQCDGGGEITMYSDAPANPVIDASDKNICKGSVINLTDDDTSAATKYIWEHNTGSGYKVMEGKTSKDIMAYAPEETATYRLTVENGVCTRTSNEVTVKVNPPIEFKVSADQSICSGDSAVLVMSGYPATATVGWYNGNEQISESDKVMVKPTQTTVYTAKVIDVCTASKNNTVNVEPAIEYTISPDGDICVGESRQLEVTGGKYYSWSPASSLDDATSATPKATPRTTTTYEVAITTDLCSTKARTTVRVHPLPIIESIENGEQGEVVVTVKSGTEPYYYSLNGKEFVDSNIFTGLTIGAHMMYVKDSATCKTEQMFEVPPVPVIPDVFFSPNDDGLYDLWTVKNLNFYSEYKVEIYDRYGRRLLSFGKGGYSGEHSDKDFIGWDGYYNGHQMPSGDYWYIITVEEIRKQIKGHFVLKR